MIDEGVAATRSSSTTRWWSPKPDKLGPLLALFWERRRQTLVAVILLIAAGLLEGIGLMTLLPLLNSSAAPDDVITETVAATMATIGLEPTIGPLLLVLVLALLIKAGLFMLAMERAGVAAVQVSQQLRRRLLDSLFNARWGYFVEQPLGELANAVGAEAIKSSYMYTAGCLFLATVIQVAVYLTLAFLTSWYVSLGAAALGILLLISLRRFVQTSRKAGAEEAVLLRSLSRRLADAIGAFKPLKAMGLEHRLLPALDRETSGLYQAQRQQVIAGAAVPALSEPVVATFLAAGIFIAVSLTGAELQQLLFMVVLFHRTATRLGSAQSYYQSVASFHSSYIALVEMANRASLASERLAGANPPDFEKTIAFERVSFAYADKKILNRISFELPSGTITALLGPSGAGKTTIADLLCRLNSPTEGRITVGEHSLDVIDPHLWRKGIGYVTQDPVLLHDTLAMNITLGDPSIGEDQIRRYLEMVGLWDYVGNLPERLQHLVGERGARLSGGQRQRLALCRALVREPKLLILDEATSGLDKATEATILDALKKLPEKLTILAISHQPSISEFADRGYAVNLSVEGARLSPI